MHFADEVLDHLLGDFEVGDDAVAHRPDCFDVARRSSEHHLGVVAHVAYLLLAPAIDGGDDVGFVQHDAPALDVDQRVRCSEIDRHIARQGTEKTAEHSNLSNPSQKQASASKGPGLSRRGPLTHRATVSASGACFSRFTKSLLSALT